MPKEKKNRSKKFRPYKDEKSILEKQDIKKDPKNLVGKSLDTRNYTKTAC